MSIMNANVVDRKWNIEQSVSFPHCEKLFIASYDITQFRPRKFFSNRFEDVESLSRGSLKKKFHLLESSYKEICKSYGFLRSIKKSDVSFLLLN